VFQPDFLIDGLEIPAILAKNGAEITLHVINLSNHIRTVPAKTKLGTVTEAVEVAKPASPPVINQVITDTDLQNVPAQDLSSVKTKMPEHLQDLFKHSSENLTEAQSIGIGKLLI
jgi:hypothetical protein